MAEQYLVEGKLDLPTCCAVGREVYPAHCPEHGAQVPPDLPSVAEGAPPH